MVDRGEKRKAGYMVNVLDRFVADESGQGITEYGAILAFVAVLIVVVAGFVNGNLKDAISTAYQNCTSALNALNAQVS